MAEVTPDPLWTPASSLLVGAAVPGRRTVALLGVSTYATSVTPRSWHSTPLAVREALARYSTHATGVGDLAETVGVVDYGDVFDPDGEGGTARTAAAMDRFDPTAELVIVLGGDNAATFHAMSARAGAGLPGWGLVTLDAHHDVRDGTSNGSPVRQLLDAGLAGSRVAPVGSADFATRPAYAARARAAGITVISRDEVRATSPEAAAAAALAVAGEGPIYLDVDLDVCDRASVPGCPAALPGGLSADEARRFVRACASDPRVAVIDVTEVDVERDSPDGRTVRLAALVVLDALVAVARRPT
jgi:formiminoglutamase